MATAQHNNAQLLRTNSVSISAPFTPFGSNVTFNKFGDDGSSAVLDASGVLIWVDSSGNYREIPNSELATPLCVSNGELIVWKNRFVDYDFYPNKPAIEVSLFRADASGALTETPIDMGGKEVMETASLTTTTSSLMLVTTERSDNGIQENIITNPNSNTVDDIIIRSYRVSFSGAAQRLSQVTRQITADSATFARTQIGPVITQLGWGSDGAILLRNVTTGGVEFLWMNGDGKFVNAPVAAASEVSSVVYLSNLRMVYYSTGGTTGYYEFNRNPATGNLVTNTPTLVAGVTGSPLNFPKVTRVGYDQYFYTFAVGNIIRTYKLTGSSGATLVRSATIGAVTGLDAAEVKAINPADGAAMLVRGENVIWLNSNPGVNFNILPAASNQAEPMFVSDTEAVVWNNAHAPVGVDGQRPLISVKHYARAGAIITPTDVKLKGLPATPVAGDGPGRVILDTPDITLNPDGVGWFFTTAEKTSTTSALFRTYRLYGPDTDGDGLDNVEEGTLGTNPALVDTDGDGLSDYEEVRNRLTNPLVADTDGDGLSDGVEVLNGTNPLDVTDPVTKDTDGDGLTDYQEIFTYGTNKTLVDTDGDGLTDYEEIFVYSTDPLNPDTDGDGVSDGVEIKVTHTNPTVPSFGNSVVGAAVTFTDPAVNGTYTGLVFNNIGTPVGTLTVKVTNKGTYTASEQGIGLKGSFRGTFDGSNGFAIGATGTLPPGFTDVRMELGVEPFPGTNYQIQGHFDSPSGTHVFELRRPASAGVVAPVADNYTFGASAAVFTGPTGDLIGTGTVATNGKVTMKVYLPDNQTGTFSGTLNNGALVPLFVGATTNARIAVAGNLVFRDLPGVSDFDGDLRMIRLPGIGTDIYNPGYDETRSAIGSRFSSAALIGLGSIPASTSNVVGLFNGGILTGTEVVATWTSNGQITAPKNANFAFSGKYDKRAGLATATYTVTDVSLGLSNAKAPTRSVPIQKQDRIAGHYYLSTGAGQFSFAENVAGTPPAVTTLSDYFEAVPAAGKTYVVAIQTPAAWDAEVVDATTNTWVTFDGVSLATTSGTGNGTVTIYVAANATGLKREAWVRIGGQLHKIFQDFK
ncbi:hypothetical protein [Luteolibacter sp. LG18]|uniref:hypothetical protein n=1 Tax=Luteolibacter sp. LG18 TaxID=2819286 RepID=UPI002B30AF77|nr:hypothetical protein llg_02790 [Luteolibacter sp. LG18]